MPDRTCAQGTARPIPLVERGNRSHTCCDRTTLDHPGPSRSPDITIPLRKEKLTNEPHDDPGYTDPDGYTKVCWRASSQAAVFPLPVSPINHSHLCLMPGDAVFGVHSIAPPRQTSCDGCILHHRQ